MPDYGTVSMMQSAASVGAQIITNKANNKIARIQADTANYVREQNNTVVKAENERDAVLTATQRWRQSVTNSRVYENDAKDREVIETNYWRQADARKRANFSDQIRFAEEQGRMAAAAAMSGASGSVVDMLENTAKLRKGMENVQRNETEQLAESDKSRLEFAQHWANLDQMDYSLILDNPRVLDFQNNVPRGTGLLTGVNTRDIKNFAQGASDFFQPPPQQLTIYGDAPTDNYHEMVHQ